MNYNKKLVCMVIVLLILVWVGNILYYEERVIKEPIFLKHYYDIPQGMESIQLYYLDSPNSDNRVVNVSFPEFASNFIQCNENNCGAYSSYYTMKRVDLTLYRGDVINMPKEYKNKLLTKAEVLFSNGKSIIVDIGKIYLYEDAPEEKAIKMLSSSGSSDNSTTAAYEADEDISVSGINCRFPELLRDIIKPEINGTQLENLAFPMKIKKGESLSLCSKFSFNNKDIRTNYVYSFTIDLLAKNTEGKGSYATLYINYWPQFLKQFDIKDLKGR